MPEETIHYISAPEIGSYVVCPEAWRLKYIVGEQYNPSPPTAEVADLKREWREEQELSSQLKNYARISYLSLVALTILVFIWDLVLDRPRDIEGFTVNQVLLESRRAIPTQLLFLLLVLGLIIFLWDLFDRKSRKLRHRTGLEANSELMALKGSEYLPAEELRSRELGLVSRPDALVRENGILIPVDRKPLAREVRDRHVVQLLVHLRLLEEREGKKPPYGILLLGTEVQKKIIRNTDEKQRWLDTLIDEMRSIRDGIPAVPAPAPHKCRRCDVREQCSYRKG